MLHDFEMSCDGEEHPSLNQELGIDRNQEQKFTEKLRLNEKIKQIERDYKLRSTTAEDLISQSNKVKFLFRLLDDLKKTGHRVLIFSKTKFFI